MNGQETGAELAWELRGPAGGPLILWLHGFLGARVDWQEQVAALPGYRHLLVDLPGHGASPRLRKRRILGLEVRLWPGAVDGFDAVAEALLACCDAVAPGEVVSVVGYSLGARVAMALLPRLHQMERLGRAVLISGHPGLTDVGERRARLAVDEARAARLRAVGLPAFVREWYAMPLLQRMARVPGAAEILARRSVGDPEGVARTLVALSSGRQPDRLPGLGAVAERICWLAGAEDEKYVAVLRRAWRATPGSELRVVAGAGHQVQLERPARTAAVVKGWLSA